ncbi:N-acetyl-glucosamine-6-phosphate deacetylase [Tulasnella sp. 425]|nr:N-acetyl-glucosamine-6-phosphate deacetylase [Tulasnella sp. 425]
MLEFVWNSFTLPSWSSVRTAMVRIPFLPTFVVLPLTSNTTVAPPGLGLWPNPSSLSTGSQYVKVAQDFNIAFMGEGRIPEDLNDAMRNTKALIWHDHLERLVVGRGSVDAEALLNSSISTLKVLELRLAPGSNNLKSIYENTVGVEAFERDESYRLEVPSDASTATLIANNTLFYLSEKTVYTFKAPIVISDKPAFPHRGTLLDTSRNFFTKDDILLTIDAMSWSKLNVLHWHVVDSQSFPLQVPAFPELAEKGAYDSRSIYTVEDVRDIVKYAGSHGVDVLVEIDTPGHTTAIAESHPEHIACANAVPWVKYAHEPPAGQLRITSQETIKFTAELFSSVMGMFPSKYFSPGGDEVNFKCYAHDPQSQVELKSSKKTLEKALSSYVEQTHSVITGAGKTPVVWEEMVLRHKIKLVNDTVALVWKSSSHAAKVAKKGYRIIHVPSDYFYLDCGAGFWAGDDPNGKSWCANTLDSKLWPRAAAAAEVFWTGAVGPDGQPRSVTEAFPRLQDFRYRLVERGIRPVALQPYWCALRPHACDL